MTQQQEHKKQQVEPMSQKEALAVLCQLRETYLETAILLEIKTNTRTFETETHKAFRAQVRTAIAVLATALHGSRPLGSIGLCEVCHLHYATYDAWYKKDTSLLHRCACSACYHCLQQEHTLLTEDEVDKE